MSDLSGLESQLKKNVQGEVRFDAYSRVLYSTDASIFQVEPVGVVIPRNADDVAAAVELAASHDVPILPRGGGTSLAGQAIGRALVIDFSKYMNRVLEADAANRRVRVEPGVVLDELNRELRPAGLFFPPDPATASRCNVGGMIGNNSSGSRSIVYGKTIDYVERLRVLLATGEKIETSPLTPLEVDAKRRAPGREGEIYRESLRIAEENRDEIARRFPKILRRVGGYNLDSLLATGGLNHCLNMGHVLTGSEGTLGVILEAELRLVPRPKTTAIMVAHFRELTEALEATQTILETSPSAVELVDRIVIELTRGTQEYNRRMTFVEGDPSALLLIEYSGESAAEMTSKLDDAESKLRSKSMGFAFVRALDQAAQANIWKVRNAGQGLLLGMVGDRKPATFVEDTAVSPEKLPEYIRRFQQIVREHGTEACFYAHASVGCLHIRPLIDLKQAPEREKLQSIAEAVSDLVLEFSGSLSGEHGDGMVRSPFNEKMFGPKLYSAFRELKRVFDPKGLMNPGKIVEAMPLGEAMAANLRIRPSAGSNGESGGEAPYAKATAIGVPFDLNTTRLDFGKQGGFARAIEMCSGVGACRKRGEGAMCPSYMATNEEEHSTRGRAVLLQAAISGRLPGSELVSERMHRALDLCLECKGCKGECPANVDMAKLKYEFLARYHDAHGVPLRAKLFGNVAAANERASKFAPLYNWCIRNGLVRAAMESVAGIDRHRELPPLARERFSTWFAKHKATAKHKEAMPRNETAGAPAQGAMAGNAVALFVDTFTEYNYPSIGIAAVNVLERLGYEVKPIAGRCCGRPLISKGLLDQAAENARANVALLRDITDRRMPIVGLEPSCLLTFRDEYPDLLPGAEAQRVARNCFLFEELLTPERKHPNGSAIFQPMPKHALFHGHCHLKALVGSEPSLLMLRTIPELKVDEIDSGCCGMAGSFGYEKEHYDLSIQIAERRLAPAVRSLPAEDLVIAGGLSCRQQIADRTGRKALHPAEVMAMAMLAHE